MAALKFLDKAAPHNVPLASSPANYAVTCWPRANSLGVLMPVFTPEASSMKTNSSMAALL